MLITIAATIIVLGVLIFVHELGHFLAAKSVDIEVPRFSIGLGPKMIGFTRGETEYVISWLPLGGYVKMAGMEEMEAIEGGPSKKAVVTGAATADDLGIEVEDKRVAGPRDFEAKSLPARVLVISAGVLMNLLFAFLVFAVSAFVWGVRRAPDARIGGVAEELLPQGTEALALVPSGTRITRIGGAHVQNFEDVQAAIAKVSGGPLQFEFEAAAPVTIQVPARPAARDSLIGALEPQVKTSPVVGEVSKNSPAAAAGLQRADKVLRANGQAISTWQQFVSIIERNAGRPVHLVIDRKGRPMTVTVTPEGRSLRNKAAYGRIGISADPSAQEAAPREKVGPFNALQYGVARTWQMAAMTVGFLKDLLTGGASPRNLGGPILIGQLSGQVARAGLEAFLGFMALFSVNLAVLNLLPIPVLDGGHLAFLLVEAVRGRPLSLEQRMRASQVGFVIVIAIMVWAVGNDILRLFGL